MRLIFVFSILLNAGLVLYAQTDNRLSGARSAAMADAGVVLSDVWSVFHNQAGLAFLANPEVGLYYEKAYFTAELNNNALAFAMPSRFGNFGLNLSYFGFSLYNESRVGLAYAMKLGEKMAAGLQLNYFNYYLAESYGNKGTLAGEIGFMAFPGEKLRLAAHIFNPTRAQIAEYQDERMETVLRLGAGYDFAPQLLVTAEAEKNMTEEARFKAGMEYNLGQVVYLRTGIATNPVSNNFGLGINLKQMNADLAVAYHQVLGYTFFIGLGYRFDKQFYSK